VVGSLTMFRVTHAVKLSVFLAAPRLDERRCVLSAVGPNMGILGLMRRRQSCGYWDTAPMEEMEMSGGGCATRWTPSAFDFHTDLRLHCIKV